MGSSKLGLGIVLPFATALSACSSQTFDLLPGLASPTIVTCAMDRLECTGRMSTGSSPVCLSFVRALFTATACKDPGDQSLTATCQRVFCSKTDGLSYQSGAPCKVQSALESTLPHNQAGICVPDGVSANQALVTYQQTFSTCQTAADNTACGTITRNTPEQATLCVDLSENGAVAELQPPQTLPVNGVPQQVINGSVNVTAIALNQASCGPVGPARMSGELNYQMPVGNIGSVSGGGTSANLAAIQGTLSISNHCFEYGCDQQIDKIAVNFSDLTIQGTTLTALSVNNVGIAVITPSAGHGVIAPGGLTLQVSGRINGAVRSFVAKNSTPWRVDTSAQAATISGTIDLLSSNAQGKAVPIVATVNATASVATTAQAACASLSPVQALFGFEDRSRWSSPNSSLSAVTSPIRQGCSALGVAGQNFINIDGETFSNAAFTVKPALSVDLFIPNNQPNPWYLGALQMFLTCPSAGVINQYFGQVLLTGLPQNAFSTLRFPLPTSTSNTLKSNLNDCRFSFGLNVNPTNRTWVLDNLRFTP